MKKTFLRSSLFLILISLLTFSYTGCYEEGKDKISDLYTSAKDKIKNEDEDKGSGIYYPPPIIYYLTFRAGGIDYSDLSNSGCNLQTNQDTTLTLSCYFEEPSVDASSRRYIQFYINPITGPGQYDETSTEMVFYYNEPYANNYLTTASQSFLMEITGYTGAEGYISGYFQGTVMDTYNNATIAVEGSFSEVKVVYMQ